MDDVTSSFPLNGKGLTDVNQAEPFVIALPDVLDNGEHWSIVEPVLLCYFSKLGDRHFLHARHQLIYYGAYLL